MIALPKHDCVTLRDSMKLVWRWNLVLVGLFIFPLLTHSETVVESFEEIWSVARANIYPEDQQTLFSDSAHTRLRRELNGAGSLRELAAIVNPFLDQLKVSHTRLYVEPELDYYFFRSLFATRDAGRPKVFHIGGQFQAASNGTMLVKAVLEGFPLDRAGLRRGDRILAVDGKPFHPVESFTGKQVCRLTFERNGRRRSVEIRPVESGLPEAFLAATRNSARVLQAGKRKVGYVHLWFGGFDSDLILSNIVQSKFQGKVDGLILDLRDGFGAAWWNHLDPFFPDRNDYFVSTTVSRDGSQEDAKPEPRQNPGCFSGPMVVLINEEVRSGKEALAYQFEKTRRAFLIGERTAGAFVAGKGFFAEEENGYLLYLSVKGVLLDGNAIEGQGVAPDKHVPYPLDKVPSKDPQLEAALEQLRS